MKKYCRYGFCIIILVLFNTTSTAEQKSIDIAFLINKISLEEVVDITQKQFAAVLVRKNKQCDKGSNEYCWSLKKRNMQTVILASEHERLIFRMYPMKESRQLFLINNQGGNHLQTHSFYFYIYDEKSGAISEQLRREQFIPDIGENEFLMENNRFSENIEGLAIFIMNDNGEIEVGPWTWMEARWENKDPKFEIKYKWDKNNERFVKIKYRLQ